MFTELIMGNSKAKDNVVKNAPPVKSDYRNLCMLMMCAHTGNA